jgi:ribonuclease E
LIDALHPEETRVAVVNANVVEFYDFEITSMKSKKGNIYLGKVIRIEPSLQAAFVDYGQERQGFLPLNEIHPQYWLGAKAPYLSNEKIDRKSKRIENILKINQFLKILL